MITVVIVKTYYFLYKLSHYKSQLKLIADFYILLINSFTNWRIIYDYESDFKI